MTATMSQGQIEEPSVTIRGWPTIRWRAFAAMEVRRIVDLIRMAGETGESAQRVFSGRDLPEGPLPDSRVAIASPDGRVIVQIVVLDTEKSA